MNRVTPQDHLPELLSYALVAPRIKVLYVPTTKVACSSLKLLVSQIEGTYNATAAEEIITPNISQEQTIHNYRVHGLTRFFELPRKEQWNILTSPDWLRIAALRDPLRRAYSSFENRVLLRAPGTPQVIFDRCPDVLVDGRIDVAATFANFAEQLHADLPAFMADDHFRPQFNSLYCDQYELHHLVRVDQPGALQDLADVLNARGGTNVTLARLNSGLGISPSQIYTNHTADLVAETYAEDYRWFDFAPHTFTAASSSLVLDPLQQALITNLRETTERLKIVSRSAFHRVGFRYGLKQMRKSLWIRITNPRGKGDTRLLQW